MFIAEDLLNEEGIKDLMTRDADAPIFGRLGLTYGKAVRFKAEFAKLFPERKGITCKCKTSNGGCSLLLPGRKEHLPTEVSSFGMFLIFSKVFEFGNILCVNKQSELNNSEFGNITRPIIQSLSIVYHRSSCNFCLHSLSLSILCYTAYIWNQFVCLHRSGTNHSCTL